MTTRKPLVIISGAFSELPQGDSVDGSSVLLVANPSGLFLADNELGLDGAAQTTADTALASGNAALTLAASSLSSNEVIGLIVALS